MKLVVLLLCLVQGPGVLIPYDDWVRDNARRMNLWLDDHWGPNADCNPEAYNYGEINCDGRLQLLL